MLRSLLLANLFLLILLHPTLNAQVLPHFENFCSSANTSGEINPVNYWHGVASTNWSDPQNWSLGHVPAPDENVIIEGQVFNPVISDKNASCNNLTVTQNGNLTILPEAALKVAGNLVTEAGGSLNLRNSYDSYSALFVAGKVTGDAKIEYLVRKNTSCLISPPVKESWSGVFLNMYLRTFDEELTNWGSYIVPTQLPLIPMKGYEVYSMYTDVRSFIGTPNCGTQQIELSTSDEGWNLVGNPFTTFINWDFASNYHNPQNQIVGAIYYPDNSNSGNFSVYLPGNPELSINGGSRFIPPMQGFFIKAIKPGLLSFPTEIQSLQRENHVPQLPPTALKFRITSGTTTDECIVSVTPGSTFSFDDLFDAIKLPVQNSSIIFSTGADAKQYAINSIPSVTSSSEIELGIKNFENQSIKLEVFGGLNFEYRYPIMLEDKITGKILDLRKDSVYYFAHSPLSLTNRFILKFDYALGGENRERPEPDVYYSAGSIVAENLGFEKVTISVYAIDGKLLFRDDNVNEGRIILPVSGNHKLLIVKVCINGVDKTFKLVVS